MEHYCHTCGVYQDIFTDTKLCRKCTENWLCGTAFRIQLARSSRPPQDD